MDTYSSFRLTSWSEIEIIKQKMGKEAFRVYLNNVYTLLLKMDVGDYFIIDKNVKPENTELFIKIVCLFISEGNGDYEFCEDYHKVRRS